MNFKITFFIFSIFEIYADVSASQIADANADKLNVRKVYGPQTGSIRSIDFNWTVCESIRSMKIENIQSSEKPSIQKLDF